MMLMIILLRVVYIQRRVIVVAATKLFRVECKGRVAWALLCRIFRFGCSYCSTTASHRPLPPPSLQASKLWNQKRTLYSWTESKNNNSMVDGQLCTATRRRMTRRRAVIVIIGPNVHRQTQRSTVVLLLLLHCPPLPPLPLQQRYI